MTGGDVATIVEADAEAMLASVRAAAKTQMERALDDATRAATESWARERERWVAERAALESRAEALSALVADGEARNASLEEQLRDAEHAGALAAAETRKTRAELDEARDEQEGRFQRLRAEVKVWEDACVKYRKRMEHAERALSRLSVWYWARSSGSVARSATCRTSYGTSHAARRAACAARWTSSARSRASSSVSLSFSRSERHTLL